eukprot:635348_1
MTSQDDDEKEIIHTELDVTETELINPCSLDDEKSEEIVSDESADTKKAKHILHKLLMTRSLSLVKISNQRQHDDDIKDWASRIVDEAMHYAQSDHKLYCNKMRNIMFNLSRNMSLLNKVFNGTLTPKELVSMDVWQMASTELSQQRLRRQCRGKANRNKTFNNYLWNIMMTIHMRSSCWNPRDDDDDVVNEMFEICGGVDEITLMMENFRIS